MERVENDKAVQNEGCAASGAAAPGGHSVCESGDSFQQVDCFLNAEREVVSGEPTAQEGFSL